MVLSIPSSNRRIGAVIPLLFCKYPESSAVCPVNSFVFGQCDVTKVFIDWDCSVSRVVEGATLRNGDVLLHAGGVAAFSLGERSGATEALRTSPLRHPRLYSNVPPALNTEEIVLIHSYRGCRVFGFRLPNPCPGCYSVSF